MRRPIPSVLTRRTWWWVFVLLIALPAVTLMALGLRAIRLEDRERLEQARRERQQTARLVDTALTVAFDRLLSEPGAAVREDHAEDRIPFAMDNRGVLALPEARLFTGPFGASPALAESLPSIDSLSEAARRALAAHAQHRLADAAALYREARRDPSLQRWADLQEAVVRLQLGDISALGTVADPRWAEIDARSPDGVPLALLASSAYDVVSPRLRSRFAPLLLATLGALRNGRWWLDVDASRVYERELLAWTGPLALGVEAPSVTRYAELMPRLQKWLERARGSARAVFIREEPAAALVIWADLERDQSAGRRGVVLGGSAIESLFATSMTSLMGHGRVSAVLSDDDGRPVWSSGEEPPAEFQRLESVSGLQVGLGVPEAAPTTVWWRRTRNYGLIVVPALVLACGLVMTVWIARRELALVRQQSEFVAAVTHEFKSPLTGIRLLMERLTRTRPPNDAGRKYYAAIDAETARLEGLVDRLLEVQKLQAGQREFHFGLMSIDDLAAGVVRRLAPHAEARGIRLLFDAAPDLPSVSIDREAIADALGNLIDNAIKYSPANTDVAVRVHTQANHVVVRVIDEGVGVDPAEATRIFEPFYRSARGDHASVQGTGLGLALVKAAADAHGADVTVESNGRGSCFTMRLPARREE